jgi:hypothetical protein
LERELLKAGASRDNQHVNRRQTRTANVTQFRKNDHPFVQSGAVVDYYQGFGKV